jgi:UDP-N-acetylmuramoylalanine--D-glutamate ligase
MNTFATGETLLIIGLGRSGQASTEVLRGRGAQVYVVDENPSTRLEQAITHVESIGACFIAPDRLHELLPRIDAAVLSPGVPLNGSLVRGVQDANIPVYSEIELAYRFCAAPIIAVTGTKGKSTTTSLIGHLIEHCIALEAPARGRVHVGGNIGNPLIKEVLDATPDDWVVAEVSSFQLESIRAFRPRVSVILNISADHLDRYHSMEEYAEAKYRIFANQSGADFFVGNLDDERLRLLHWQSGEIRLHARQLWFTLGQRHEHASMYVRNDMVMFAPLTGDPRPVEIMRIADIPLAGRHNVQNVMGALLAALAIGMDPRALGEAVKSFRAMEHRLQPIGRIGEVAFIDDSKATNPGSVIAALHAYDRPIVLIAGGRSKNTDFTELGRVIDERVSGVVVIGEAAEDLAAHVYRTPIERAATMEDAVRAAISIAKPGSIVLLSPGCASFDMFESAEDRGQQFIAAVHALSERPAGSRVTR